MVSMSQLLPSKIEQMILKNEVNPFREVEEIFFFYTINYYRIMQNGSRLGERVWRQR